MRYLITGGYGFIGRHLSAALRQHDPAADVICTGLEADLTVRDTAMDLFRDCGSLDYIVHLADVAGDASWSQAHAVSQFLANSYMATHVIDAWTTHQPRARLVGMSTLWAYPERVVEAVEDRYWDGRLHVPTEHYGLVKKLFGAGIAAARRERGARGTMLVLGSVYGPGDATFHVIPSLIRRMRENVDRLEVFGDGTQTRDFIFVDDQVEGIVRHLDYDGDLLNIGSGVTHSIREVVACLARLMPYAGRIVFQAAKASGVRERRMDVTCATAATGWPANVALHSLDAGLAKTLAAWDRIPNPSHGSIAGG
jgi:nucleoside-diphosphate-sugar epimerase